MKVFTDSLKREGKCLFCGEDDPDVLDFHHVNPEEKQFHVSNAWRHYGIKRIKEEVAKCVIVCANCHRRIHAGTLEVNRES